jgi:hypothetical protein
MRGNGRCTGDADKIHAGDRVNRRLEGWRMETIGLVAG